MTPIASAIQSLGLSGTAAEIRTALDSAGTPITDSTSYSLSGLATQLAIQGVDAMILVGLRNHIRTLPVGGDTLEGFLIAGGGSSGGVDCSRADIRYQIGVNQSHPSTSAEQQSILSAMLLVGSTPRKKFEQAGLDELPSEQEITTAKTEISAHETWSHVRDDLVPVWLTQGKTWAEIKTLITAEPEI